MPVDTSSSRFMDMKGCSLVFKLYACKGFRSPCSVFSCFIQLYFFHFTEQINDDDEMIDFGVRMSKIKVIRSESSRPGVSIILDPSRVE